MFNIPLPNLINLQKGEEWIVKLLEHCNDKSVFLYQGLIMRKFQLANNTWISHLVLPQKLASKMIKYYHERAWLKHESVHKMKRHLQTIFKLRLGASIGRRVCRSVCLTKFSMMLLMDG